MNLNLLHQKLIRAARLESPSQRVPYAFEQRIMALLPQGRVPDGVTLWARALWRAAIPCLAVAVVIALWPGPSGPSGAAPNETADLSVTLESTLMASVSMDNNLAW